MSTTKINISNRKIIAEMILANPSDTTINNIYSSIIDTGSVESLISVKIINDLKLTKSGDFVTTVDMYGAEVTSDRYKCYILFNGHVKTFEMNIGIIHRKDVDLIIGMDILELIDINIKGNLFTINI